MPLAFESLDHGTLAFGFFNIDTDMLLLEHDFFFAPEFCDRVSEIAAGSAGTDAWEVHHIPGAEDIGDLMGAIHKIRHTGFIGAVYRRFPFPEKPEDFRQKPDGFRNRAEVEGLIEKFSRPLRIPFVVDAAGGGVQIGAFRFSREVFHELIRYVWRGGYPKWKHGKRPDAVLAMATAVERSTCPHLEGLDLENGGAGGFD